MTLYRDQRLTLFMQDKRVRDFQGFERQLKRCLAILHDAGSVNDVRALPGNHFEALGGDRRGQCSIRVNQHYRLCFEWPEGAEFAYNIEVVDYH